MEIITHSNFKTKQIFFSSDHLQGMQNRAHWVFNTHSVWLKLGEDRNELSRKEIELSDDWVPVTTYLPHYVSPREGLEDGIVDTKEKFLLIYHSNDTVIENPDPRYQV